MRNCVGRKMEEAEAANKAAVESCHGVLNLLSQLTNDPKSIMFETREAVSKFRRVTSLLSSGSETQQQLLKLRSLQLPQHLFLESPVSSNNAITVLSGAKATVFSSKSLSVYIPNHQQGVYSRAIVFDGPGGGSCYSPSVSNGSRSFVSSLSMDTSVADYSRNSDLIISPSIQGGQAALVVLKCGGRSKCHCSKKRKLRVRRSIKVPAISNKIADIPPDEYSWRKYGQKPIKGSPLILGGTINAAACEVVQQGSICVDETSMLIVTYEGEHNHREYSLPISSNLINQTGLVSVVYN
ncbi:LOW QUALITY PROTEIN: hypothetical protein HID58_090972, partial [Brassica napus]